MLQKRAATSLVACDSALIVVDVVEGMGARTHQVLREAHAHQLHPLLVVNKIDRLCVELKLTADEAYLKIRTLLETVNAASAAILTAAENRNRQNIASAAEAAANGGGDRNDKENGQNGGGDDDWEERQHRLWTFDPAANNVVFASALYGMGFTTTSLARSLYRRYQQQEQQPSTSSVAGGGGVGIKPVLLKQYLFGDYKYNPHTNKVLKWKQHQDGSDSGSSCMFAEFALQPLWDVFEGVHAAAAASVDPSSPSRSVSIQATSPGMDQVLSALQSGNTTTAASSSSTISGIGGAESIDNNGKPFPTAESLQSVLTRTGASTEQAVLRCILRRYRNLSITILDAICEYCPSPVDAQAPNSLRSNVLRLQQPTDDSQRGEASQRESQDDIDTRHDGASSDFAAIQTSVAKCDPSGPCVAYVSKFISTDPANIRDRLGADDDGSGIVLLGMARVLSGKLRTGKEYFCFGPNHQPNGDVAPVRKAIRLYIVMGSSFSLVDEVPAGHLCAVSNLQELQFKTVTLSDSPRCTPLRGFDRVQVRPLLKVNVEPQDAADEDDLERGLIKLSLTDAAVEVTATEKGERILACLGELHLEQSIHDLETVYCRRGTKLRVSDPILEFGETTVFFDNESDYASFVSRGADMPPLPQLRIPPYNEEEDVSFSSRGRMRSVLTGRVAAILIRVVPLVDSLYKAIEQRSAEGCEDEIMRMGQVLKVGSTATDPVEVLKVLAESLCCLGPNGNALVETPAVRWGLSVCGIELDEVYVPSSDGGCDNVSDETAGARDVYEVLKDRIHSKGFERCCEGPESQRTATDLAAFKIWEDIKGSAIRAGFQLALRSGPICEEPMRNILVVLEGVEIAVRKEGERWKTSKHLSGGMVVSALRIGIRCGFLSRPVRLMEGMLRLTLHSSLSGLGPLYSVLSKRRGRVIDESMVDDGTTDLLSITALIPQAEAFGLTSELLRVTKGHVTAPEMIFSHWHLLGVDPFWVPTSQEEQEDYGSVLMGDSSTGVDNPALQYIRQVRQRKGLMVDSSRTVVAAEKQRTLKR